MDPWICSAAAFKQVLWNAARATGQPRRRGIMGRTSMDSTVHGSASADPQMPSLMDFDQENTFCCSVNASLREPQHYFFVLLLFLAKLSTHVCACLLLVLSALGRGHQALDAGVEVLTLNKCPPNTIRAGVQGWHLHVPAPPVLCIKRIFCFSVLSPFYCGCH